MMDISDPLAPSLSNNTKVGPGGAKVSSMQRTVHVVQMVAQKSCRTVCQVLGQMFCCPVDSVQCQKVTCCHQPTKDKTQGALHNPPSTILILNISNSTLIDCVIGSDAYPPAVAERQPLMRDSSKLQMQGQVRCSCCYEQQGAANTSAPSCPPPPSAEHHSISIHNSHLNCVIIGDNNYMQAEQTHLSEQEEPHE